MAAYIALESINGKAKASQTPINAARHNLRTIKAEMKGRPGDHIDPKRTKLNRILRGPGNPDEVVALMNKRISDYGAKAVRKDQIMMFEVVVDPNQTIQDVDDFFEAAVLWMVDWFDCPLVSAVVHYDETKPHMHMLFVPLLEGRLQGDRVMGKRQDLRRMHKAFQAQVGKRFGLADQKKFTAKERTIAANAVMAKITYGRPADWLSADALFQLRKAISNASDFDRLVSAFGLDEDKNPIGVHVDTQDAQENVTQKHNPYQCVGVQSLDLPVGQEQTDADTAPEAPEQQVMEVDVDDEYIRERDDEQDSGLWNPERGEYLRQPLVKGRRVRDEARAKIMRAMPVSWSGSAFLEEVLGPS